MRLSKVFLVLTLAALVSPLYAEGVDLDAPLPVDPNITLMGELPNGMAYWIRPNQTPPEKVGILLHIGSGSLDETEDQRGLAHFLEHMAFNGSANFPPGEVVKLFGSLGLQFGNDQNAFTSFDQTSYILNMPKNDTESLSKALLFMSDVAFRLNLAEEELDKERDVILAEKRARSGAGMRLMEETLPLLMPGSRVVERIPIGKEEVIKGAPREAFLAYYGTWYRPENSTLIITGDVDVGAVEKMIVSSFSDWKRSEKPAVHADAGIKLSQGLRAGVVTDKEVTSASVGVGVLRELRPRATVGDYRERMVGNLAGSIMNRRLRRMVQEGKAPFQSASVSSRPFLGQCEMVEVEAEGEPDKTLEMLKAALVEVRRATVHGFRQDELDTAKKAVLAGLEQSAARESTVDSMSWLMRLNRSVALDRKPMSLAQNLELGKALLPTIKLEEVVDAFRKMAVLDQGLILATMPEKEGIEVPTKEELLATYKAAAETEVTATAEEEGEKGFLAKDPEPGKIVDRSVREDLGVVSASFENGVAVHVKQTDFRKDSVQVVVRLVGGVIEETEKTRGLTMAASIAMNAGMAASRRHTSAELADLMTGRKFGFGANAGDATFELILRGSPTEMDDGFRLLHLLLTQPVVEKNSLDRMRQMYIQQLGMIATNVNQQAALAVNRLLSGGDVRFALPTKERAEAITVEDAQKWLDRLIASAPIEVAIAGDIDADRAVELSRRYLGSLPKRPEPGTTAEDLRHVKVDKGPLVDRVAVDTITPQAVVRIGWRGAGRADRDDHRRLFFAGQVLTERLLKEIREEKGLTYSIQCAAIPSSAYEGLGQFFAIFTAAPDKAEEAAKLTREIIEGMKANPPTEEEMKSVKAQLTNQIETLMREPSFWTRTLSAVKTRHRDLDETRDLLKLYMDITSEEIVEVLGRYLTDERHFLVVAAPRTQEAPPADK